MDRAVLVGGQGSSIAAHPLGTYGAYLIEQADRGRAQLRRSTDEAWVERGTPLRLILAPVAGHGDDYNYLEPRFTQPVRHPDHYRRPQALLLASAGTVLGEERGDDVSGGQSLAFDRGSSFRHSFCRPTSAPSNPVPART